MARGYNKVILIGNLGQDPEQRNTQSGSVIVNFNLATDESYKDRNTGQIVPKTEWHRIVLFGKIAEISGKYLKKGSKVLIEGKLQTRKWQDKDGKDQYTTEVAVDINGQMQMLDSAPGERGSQQPSGGYTSGKEDSGSSGYQGKSQQTQESLRSRLEQPDNGYGGYVNNAGGGEDEASDLDIPF